MIFLYFSIFFDLIFLVFAIVLLLKNSPFRQANRQLSITFLLMSACGFCLSFLNYAIINQSSRLLSYYYPISLIIVMFIGPSIYLYLRSLLGYSDQSLWNRMWIHAIPSLPAIIFVIYFALLPAYQRVEWLYSDYGTVRWQEYLINLFFYIQLTCYILLCIQMLHKRLKVSCKVEMNGKLTDINWLRYFFGIALVLFIIKIFICTFFNSDRINTLVGLALLDILFLYFFIHTVWETGLLTHSYIEAPKLHEPVLKVNSNLATSYFDILIQTLESDKMYLSAHCTIDDVAEKCQIPKHHLSNILNVQLHKNFTDFINEYRIRHVCLLLTDPEKQHITIEALGLECGFGSKAAFYRAFKKHTGYTPMDYKHTHISAR